MVGEVKTPRPRYLSDEWKAEQWRKFEEEQIAGDESDCGGWGSNPPCGGCARCMTMQFGYYLMKEEQQARVWLDAGFDVAPRGTVTIDHSGGYHDAFNCKMSGERESFLFPWEPKP